MMVMELVLRPATEGDRDTAHRLLTAQLVEHRLPADPDGVARGIDLALAPHSPAWLWLGQREGRDRKSTRLNSSHSQISYAVFCLKKKKIYAAISFSVSATDSTIC